MPKYKVFIHYEGCWDFDIEADSREKAEEIAQMQFDEIPSEVLMENLADRFVDDSWEITDEE